MIGMATKRISEKGTLLKGNPYGKYREKPGIPDDLILAAMTSF